MHTPRIHTAAQLVSQVLRLVKNLIVVESQDEDETNRGP